MLQGGRLLFRPSDNDGVDILVAIIAVRRPLLNAEIERSGANRRCVLSSSTACCKKMQLLRRMPPNQAQP